MAVRPRLVQFLRSLRADNAITRAAHRPGTARRVPLAGARAYSSHLYDTGVVSSPLPPQLDDLYRDVTSYEELHAASINEVSEITKRNTNI